MEIPKNIETYTFAPGTKEVTGITCRKHSALRSVVFPDGLVAIGDAAFSFCTELKSVTIPASVEHIGVAAFCGSGLVRVEFLGVPREIDPTVFAGCEHLEKIIVPKGSIDYFSRYFETTKLSEAGAPNSPEARIPTVKPLPDKTPVQPSTDIFGEPIVKRVHFNYNYQDFSWAVGDKVKLDALFSGPTTLYGDPSYQFRRKALFIFLSSAKVKSLADSSTYDVPANLANFTRKYHEKYLNRTPRIFLLVCDDNQTATIYDEVKLAGTRKDAITVKSILRK